MPTRIARSAVRVLLVVASFAALFVALVTGGVFFYSSDLPDIRALSTFAPKTPTTIADAYICGEKTRVVALPMSDLAGIRDALLAAEGDVDPRNVAGRLFADLIDDASEGRGYSERKRYGNYSLQVSRQLFCDAHRGVLSRELSELRTSVQLERRFTTDQLLNIYLNRAYFGPGIYGIESAAENYLAKPAIRLSIPEAALLVGLVKGSASFSPLAHPDRALARRNEVIDAMAKRGSISSEQAEQAKSMPLRTVADNPASHRL